MEPTLQASLLTAVLHMQDNGGINRSDLVCAPLEHDPVIILEMGKEEQVNQAIKEPLSLPGFCKGHVKAAIHYLELRMWRPHVGTEITDIAYIRASLPRLHASPSLFLDAPIFVYKFSTAKIGYCQASCKEETRLTH